MEVIKTFRYLIVKINKGVVDESEDLVTFG